MVDDLTKRGPPDAIRINVKEPWELSAWAKHFNVPEIDVRAAVAVVGVMVKDVKKFLNK